MKKTQTSTALAQPQSLQSQTDFYGRLLRLQQDVLEGNHPQYTFATPTVEPHGYSGSGSQRDPVAFDASKTSLPAGIASAHSQQSTRSFSTVLPPVNGVVPIPDTEPLGRHVASENTTIVSTKQDQVVKAQNKLERFRIERELKKAADSKTTRSGEKDTSPWDGAHSFDCSKLLQAATSLVKPVSGFEKVTANEDRPSRSPPHTDSYYSSKVDSASENEEQEQPTEDGEIEDIGAHASTEAVLLEPGPRRPQFSGLGPPSPLRITTPLCNPINTKVTSSNREDSYSPPSVDALPYVPNPRPTVDPALQDVLRAQALTSKSKAARPPTGRSRESESYSPPPVASGPPPHIFGHVPQYQNGHAVNMAQWNGPPPKNGPLVSLRKSRTKKQDKVTGPGHDKRMGRNKKQDNKKSAPTGPKSNGTNGNAHVPGNIATTVNAAPIGQATVQNNRKRPRDNDVGVSGRRIIERIEQPIWQTISPPPQIPVSPIPCIKEEPASPPPLPAGRRGPEPPRRLVLREDGTADIQVEAFRPRLLERERAYFNGRDTPLQMRPASPRYVQQEPMYLDEESQQSPPMRRRPMRDDTDLRRVASLQYARRAPSPEVQEISPREMRYAREPPQQRSSPRYQYIDDDFEPRQIVRGRHSSPIMAPEDYSPRTMMPLPPPAKRRIVVDEHGNEYIAIPAGTNARQSLAPQYIDEPRYTPRRRVSSAVPVNQPLSEQRPRPRAEPEVIDLDDDDRQVMPPPRLLSRKQRAEPKRAEPLYDFAPQLRFREEGPPQQRSMAALRPISRAVSIQPTFHHDGQHEQVYRYVSAASAYQPQQQSPVNRERPFSARPDLAQQQPMCGNGSWADTLDARASMRRL